MSNLTSRNAPETIEKVFQHFVEPLFPLFSCNYFHFQFSFFPVRSGRTQPVFCFFFVFLLLFCPGLGFAGCVQMTWKHVVIRCKVCRKNWTVCVRNLLHSSQKSSREMPNLKSLCRVSCPKQFVTPCQLVNHD